MITMWNVRMRASKDIVPQAVNLSKTRIRHELHISGVEGIYDSPAITSMFSEYLTRALHHPRGKPDKIVITIEQINEQIMRVPLLPLTTTDCASPAQAREMLFSALLSLGITRKAVNNCLKVISSADTIRGASLISMKSGRRSEPDRERGVRVSRMGIEKTSERRLGTILSATNLNTSTVKEALILASKVASYPDIIAEVCISDDPDYTTSYLAGRQFGYRRIPNIKVPGEMHGGRVFFIKDTANIKALIGYLEKQPVMSYFSGLSR